MNFKERYKRNQAEVQDTTPEEEWNLIFKRLPLYWQRKLTEEKIKLKERNPWVRLTSRSGAPTDVLMGAAENRLQVPFPDYEVCPNGIVIHTTSTEDRGLLLGLHYAVVDGYTLFASAHEYEMAAMEVFTFINKKLLVDEDLRATRDNLGLQGAVAKQPAVAAQVQFSANASKSGGRGGNKYTGSKAQAPKARAETADTSGCTTCRNAGRDFVHDFHVCEHFLKACADLAARNPGLVSEVCRACRQAGRSANHDFRKCWFGSRKGGNPGPKSSGDQPAGSPPQQASQ